MQESAKKTNKKKKIRKVRGSKSKFGAVSSVLYKSKLETYCANQLELSGISFKYEPLTFLLMDGFNFDSSWERWGKTFKQVKGVRPITYTPDFVGDNNKWIIETKGMRTESFNLKWKLFKEKIVQDDLNYILFAPSNQKEVNWVIETILEKKLYE